jgi:hypothetical protein
MSSYNEFLNADAIRNASDEEIMNLFNIFIEVVKPRTKHQNDVKKIEEFAKTSRSSEFKNKILIQFILNAQCFEAYSGILKEKTPAKFILG